MVECTPYNASAKFGARPTCAQCLHALHERTSSPSPLIATGPPRPRPCGAVANGPHLALLCWPAAQSSVETPSDRFAAPASRTHSAVRPSQCGGLALCTLRVAWALQRRRPFSRGTPPSPTPLCAQPQAHIHQLLATGPHTGPRTTKRHVWWPSARTTGGPAAGACRWPAWAAERGPGPSRLLKRTITGHAGGAAAKERRSAHPGEVDARSHAGVGPPCLRSRRAGPRQLAMPQNHCMERFGGNIVLLTGVGVAFGRGQLCNEKRFQLAHGCLAVYTITPTQRKTRSATSRPEPTLVRRRPFSSCCSEAWELASTIATACSHLSHRRMCRSAAFRRC
jgi:hypothetical protein